MGLYMTRDMTEDGGGITRMPRDVQLSAGPDVPSVSNDRHQKGTRDPDLSLSFSRKKERKMQSIFSLFLA